MTSAHKLPRSVPGTGMKGEKAKERALGIIVFLIRLVSPNMPPRNAPFFGPSRMEPMMTGTWRMVALMRGRSMSPMGVNARRKMMAENMASSTRP